LKTGWRVRSALHASERKAADKLALHQKHHNDDRQGHEGGDGIDAAQGQAIEGQERWREAKRKNSPFALARLFTIPALFSVLEPALADLAAEMTRVDLLLENGSRLEPFPVGLIKDFLDLQV